MKWLLTLSLLAVAFCACAGSKSSVPLPPGAYAVHTGGGDSRLSVELTCYADSTCAMRTIGGSPAIQPLNAVRTLDRVVRLEQAPEMALDALQYAVQNRDKPITHRDSAAFMAVSRTMLSASPEITGCWDLNDPTPSYTLVCTVRTTAGSSEQLVLFVETVMDCSDGFGFCGYATMPLTRSAAPGHLDTPLPVQWEGAKDDEDGSSPFHVDDERGHRLTMSCVFGQPQTCTWTLTVSAACLGPAPIAGLITSPAGKFPVKATCDPALPEARTTTFKLGDGQDVDRSILKDGMWEIALDTTPALTPMRFNTTGGARILRTISGCGAWNSRCDRSLPAEFRASSR